MNPSITRVCAVVAAGLGLAVTKAQAQADWPNDQDFVVICDDISTTNAKFSDDFAAARLRNDLFGATVGLSGTAEFECFGDTAFNANVGGRIGFQVGRIGSIQDLAAEGTEIDDDLMLTFGMPRAPGANWGYAKIVSQATDGTLTFTSFVDDDAIDTFYYGASDRYFYCQDTADDVLVTLRLDLLGDAARLDWTLENLSEDARGLGLWFGQWVVGLGPQGLQGMAYVNVPGQRPLNTDTRFANDVNRIVPAPLSSEVTANDYMPDHVDFGISQSWAYGLQIINSPTTGSDSAFPDQTQVDTLDIGGAVQRSPSLLGIINDNSRPMSPTFSYLWGKDVRFIESGGDPQDTGFIQRWNPVTVQGTTAAAAQRVRNIVAYYKSTTGNSNYAMPYNVVVDAPRTVAVLDTDPTQFNPSTQTIRVYIDNTRGFTTNNQRIDLSDVRIQLDLPTGLSDASDSTHTTTRMVKTIAKVPATTTDFADFPDYPAVPYVEFEVYISPEVTGSKTYTVTVAPQPGITKTLTGTINIASTPRLQINGDSTTPKANLVTAPWTFANSTWSTILGSAPNALAIDTDYQVFTWDPQRQEYVLQTGPQRGRGSFIISKKDVGFKLLGGSPSTPDDMASGGLKVQLKSGWNLIANPYNYPIQIGQIIGVTATNATQAYTYRQLAEAGIVSAALAYWDRTTQSYKFTSDYTSEMAPNIGYWVYVSTTQDVTLQYPPVFTPFIPAGTGGITSSAGWSLNVVARTKGGLDDQNFIGVAANNTQAAATRIMEPPVAPMKGSVSASFREGSTAYARSLKTKAGTMTWEMNVTPQSGDAVTLTWPSISSVPSSVALTLTDTSTGTSYDMRKMSSFMYFGKAKTAQTFKITATDATQTALLSNVAATSTTTSAAFSYKLGEAATSSIRILQSGKQIAQVTKNRSDRAGTLSATWNLRDSANRRVRSGVYVAEFTVQTSTGRTETKLVSFLVR